MQARPTFVLAGIFGDARAPVGVVNDNVLVTAP
jgi:hypothetical protein